MSVRRVEIRSSALPNTWEGVRICPLNHLTYTIHNESPSFADDASFVFICLSVIKLAAPWFHPYFNFLCELLTGCPQIPTLAAGTLYRENAGLSLTTMTIGLVCLFWLKRSRTFNGTAHRPRRAFNKIVGRKILFLIKIITENVVCYAPK